MKIKKIVLALFVISYFTSCIPSIHPLYTPDKLVFVEDLLGEWSEEKGDRSQWEGKQVTFSSDSGLPEKWFFNKSEGKSYNLVHSDSRGNAAIFETHVVKLGEHYFIDFFPSSKSTSKYSDMEGFNFNDGENEMRAMHSLPVHTFAKLNITDERVEIKMFDPDYLQKLFEQQRIRIKHEKQGDTYILTATSEELQKFVLKYAEVDEAYLEATSLKRRD